MGVIAVKKRVVFSNPIPLPIVQRILIGNIVLKKFYIEIFCSVLKYRIIKLISVGFVFRVHVFSKTRFDSTRCLPDINFIVYPISDNVNLAVHFFVLFIFCSRQRNRTLAIHQHENGIEPLPIHQYAASVILCLIADGRHLRHHPRLVVIYFVLIPVLGLAL